MLREKKDTTGYKLPSVRKLLEHLSIPFGNIHIAANDANFTLRVIFMIAIRTSYNSSK